MPAISFFVKWSRFFFGGQYHRLLSKGERVVSKQEYGNKEKSIPMAIGIGTLISFLTMIIGAAVMTLLLANQTIEESAIGYGVLLVTILSVVIGSVVSILLAHSRVLIVSLCTTLSFALILLAMTAMFFGGQYSGVPVTLMVMAGSAISVALIAGKYMNKPKSYRKKANCKVVQKNGRGKEYLPIVL